jgi:hypothetical protein
MSTQDAAVDTEAMEPGWILLTTDAHQPDAVSSAEQNVKKLPHELSNIANLAGCGDELERRRPDRTGSTLEGCSQRRG